MAACSAVLTGSQDWRVTGLTAGSLVVSLVQTGSVGAYGVFQQHSGLPLCSCVDLKAVFSLIVQSGGIRTLIGCVTHTLGAHCVTFVVL